ncbi:trypsin-like serine protease [Neoconidiobolus thromboides FSU 785]|nr:trypsin-like serine protease [Neoconidiobolus thromboides FSU 785]
MLTKPIITLTTFFNFIYSASQIQDDRIVGGVEVSPKFKYPWLVSLQVKGVHDCGGIILNRDTVLTAGHCSELPASSYTVNVHRHNLKQSSSSEGGQSIFVSKIINHPNFDSFNATNDISIWKLAIPASVGIGSIDLDDGTYGEQTGLKVLAAGWGVTKANGPGSPVLREVRIPIFDKKACASYWANNGYDINVDSQVCAGAEGGKDACNGDSGGPLFIIGANGHPILIGTTSFGEPCAHKGIPTVWTRVSAFRSFILQNS